MNKLKKISGAVLLTVSGLLLLSFLLTMCAGIVNHGNLIGSAICLAVILLYKFYGKLKKNRVLKTISICAAGFFSLAAVYTAVVSVFIISGMMNTPQRAVQAGTFSAARPHTVIVLGCKANNGVPSRMLAARLNAAVDYLNENPEAVCVLSGGQGADETEPEAESMYRYMTTHGIDGGILYKEERSRNTEENIAFSKQVIEDEGLPREVVIISESYHVFRGVCQAEKYGLNATAVPAPSTGVWWALPSYWLREVFAISRDVLAGLI